MELIGGRRTHPISMRPGGFGKLPTERGAARSQREPRGVLARPPSWSWTRCSRWPDACRPSTGRPSTSPWWRRTCTPSTTASIGSTDTTQQVPVQQFKSVVNEYVSPQSTAKWAKWHRDSYAVGALARFNLNCEQLMPKAAKTARAFGLERGLCNPYMNSVAQVVEAVHVMEHAQSCSTRC